MALNGLDSRKVGEAYETAQADDRSWFLLHYLSRDQVGLLKQGAGGLDIMRDAIYTYTEKSPIYGFFSYHESRILFKYIPDGTSRLLQVRTNVHFEAVLEYFSHFDAIFTAYAPEDFNNTAISASCFPRSSSRQTSSKVSTSYQDSQGRSETEDEYYAQRTESPGANNELRDMHPAYHESADINTMPEILSYSLRAEQNHSTVPQIETANLPSNVNEYDDTTASEQESDDDVIEELPCIEDDMISQTSSYRTNRQPGGSQEYVNRHSGSDYINRSMENFEHLRPKVKLFPRPITDARATRTAPDGTTRQKLPAGMRRVIAKTDAERAKSSRASKSPKSGKSPKSHKSRRDTSRQESVSTAPEFPTIEVVEQPVVKASSTSASMVPPPASTVEETTSHASLPTVPSQIPASDVPPLEQQVRTRAISPPNDFATLRHRPSTGIPSAPKPWLNRAASYGDSNFSVLSSEKQRLMRVLELRKQNLSPTKTSSSTTIPTADPMVYGANEKSIQERLNGVASSTRATRPEVLSADNHPSMSFLHRLMSPSSQTFPPVEPDLKDQASKEEEASSPTPSTPVTAKKINSTASRISSSNHRITEEQQAEDDEARKKVHRSEKQKRRTTIEPINTGQHWDRQYDESISDDSFMEELQNAKVQEAKPMSFAQSPRSPLFSTDRGDVRLTSGSVTSVMIHSPSRTSLRQRASETMLSSRPQLESIPYEPMQPRLSEDATTPTAVLQEPTLYASQLISNPGESLRSHSVHDRDSLSSAIPDPTPEATYERAQTEQPPEIVLPNQTRPTRPKHTNALLKDAVHTFYNVTRLTKAEPPRDHVSVTRIERKSKPNLDPRREARSAPVIAERSYEPSNTKTIDESRSSVRGDVSQSGEPPRRVLTNELPRTRPLPQPASTRKKNPTKPTVITSLPRPSTSTDGANDTRLRPKTSHSKSHKPGERTVDDKESMASQELKRMSAFPAITQHPPSQQQAEYLRDQNRASSWPQIAPPAVTIGTVEVQLPDTLLWKRRAVEVDGSGLLTLGNTSEEGNRSLARKYRLAEFKSPFAPSKDREEAPYSIVLERSEGGNLQLACSDARSHTLALRKLLNLHRAWVAFGQK